MSSRLSRSPLFSFSLHLETVASFLSLSCSFQEINCHFPISFVVLEIKQLSAEFLLQVAGPTVEVEQVYELLAYGTVHSRDVL
jgi:hypothetical protein